jgi:hypothetical protein
MVPTYLLFPFYFLFFGNCQNKKIGFLIFGCSSGSVRDSGNGSVHDSGNGNVHDSVRNVRGSIRLLMHCGL